MADTTTPIISDDLATQVAVAIKWAQADIANQQALMGGADDEDVTLTFPDGTTYTGPSFRKIMKLAGNSDFDVLGPLGAQIKQYADNAKASETIASDAATSAGSSQSVATDSANQAALSEGNAQQSAQAAQTSADAADASAIAAHTSEVNAAASASSAAGTLTTVQKAVTNAAASATSANDAATRADASAKAAFASEGNAGASEMAASASSAAAQAAKTAAESARDDAQVALTAANGAKTDAQQALSDAEDQVVFARQHAERAKAEADKLDNANAIGALVNIVDSSDPTITEQIVDFHNTPTVKGVPISGSLAAGGFHVNADLTCAATDNLNDAKWGGKNFMVQKGNAVAGGISNNTPSGMEYSQALAMDIYSGWTPANGTKGDQRVQVIYDKNVTWVRGYHVDDGKWTPWKRIVSQMFEEASNMDLNTVKDTGRYSYTRATNAPVIDASEASNVYFLEVLSADSGNEILQRVTSPRTDSMFTRYFISGSWSRWWNSTATFDVDTATAGVDINTLTNPGYWGIPLDTALNLPTRLPPNAKTGQAILTVMGLSNGGIIQRLNYLDTGEAFSRFKPSDVSGAAQAWKPWSAEPKLGADGFLSVALGGTGAGTADGARAKLNAASLGANSFIGDQNINGELILAGDHSLKAKALTIPCSAGDAQIRVGSYSDENLDARYEIFVQNLDDLTKRTNMITIDVPDTDVIATGTTNTTNAVITLAGKVNVTNSSAFNNTISLDGAPAVNYKITMLGGGAVAGTKNYLRKFRGGAPDTIWHETVSGSQYRLATGGTDSTEVFQLNTSTQQGGELFFRGGQIRITGNTPSSTSYGAFIRNDGGNLWLLATAKGASDTPIGSAAPWAITPFRMALDTGLITISMGLNEVSGKGIQSIFTGPYGFMNQYNSDTTSSSAGSTACRASFFEEITTSGESEYHPMIKQRIHSKFVRSQADATAQKKPAFSAWDGAWSQGSLIGDGSWIMHFCPSGANAPNAKSWTFRRDGSTSLPGNLTCAAISGGTLTGSALQINGSGNVTGTLTSNGAFTANTGNITAKGGSLVGNALQVNGNGTINGTLTTGAGITANNGDIQAVKGVVKSKGATLSSDISKKKNLVKMDNALDKIESITGYLWDWSDEGSSAGVIAQDVEKVQPELISLDTTDNHKMLNYSGLVGLLVNAVKELKADNAELRSQVEALKDSK